MHSSPYAGIIKYSEDIPENLSLLKVKDFLEEMKQVAAESYRVLKRISSALCLWGIPERMGIWCLCRSR